MRRNFLRQRFAYQGGLRSIGSLIFRFACGKIANYCCVRSLQRLQRTEHGSQKLRVNGWKLREADLLGRMNVHGALKFTEVMSDE